MSASVHATPFGRLADGREVERYRLEAGGLAAEILTHGGVLHRLEVPDAHGRTANVVLGLPDLHAYLTRSKHFGAITGRFANRIAGGRFTLDGRTYQLPTNNGPNTLHGGKAGFDKRLWQATPGGGADHAALELAYRSADGEEGFPGTLDVRVTYTLGEDRSLRLDYAATTDAPTVLNLTNHSYFNLAGDDAAGIHDHELELAAHSFVPTDSDGIPLGDIAAVADTPFDFRQAHPLGARLRVGHPQIVAGRGYDHCFVLDAPGLERPFARVREPHSGRVMEVLTTEPGVQVYSGNMLDGTVVGTAGLTYRQGAALCLETQHYPDSPNRPSFPSTVLRPGETFSSTTIFRFR